MSCQQLEGHVKSFYVSRAQIVLNGFERPDAGFGPKEGAMIWKVYERKQNQSLVFCNLTELVIHNIDSKIGRGHRDEW